MYKPDAFDRHFARVILIGIILTTAPVYLYVTYPILLVITAYMIPISLVTWLVYFAFWPIEQRKDLPSKFDI